MKSGLPPMFGHAAVRSTLGRAARAGTLPQSILIHGPAGVGKERLGLWLGQLLLCEQDLIEPCRSCTSCRFAERLEHPDLHWFFPLPRPDSGSPEKIREKLEEARAIELQHWRENPLHVPQFEKAPAHFLAAVRTMQQIASLRPAMGARKVFVVGDAELMVPQEASTEAANAFLKLLEEPPPETTLVLTSSQPGALLPTIRSRVLSVRVTIVSDSDVRGLLESAGVSGAKAAEAARLARGSVRRGIEIGADDKASGSIESAAKIAREHLLAVVSDSAVPRLAAAHNRRSTGARGDLMDELEALAECLRDLLAVAAGTSADVHDPSSLPILKRIAEKPSVTPRGIMQALDRIDGARDMAFGNINPQLILANLLAEMQGDLAGTP